MEEDVYFANLISSQGRIYAYIRSIHHFPHDVDDIVQETNITLMNKMSEFDHSKDFIPWAYAVARFTWMAYRKKRAMKMKRESHDPYIHKVQDSNILQHLSNEINAEKKDILEKIIKDLPAREKKLFKELLEGKKIGQIAQEWGESANKLSTCKSRMLSKVKSLVSIFRE